MSDLEGLSKFFYSQEGDKYRVYDEYETEVASFSTEQEAKDYVANKDKEEYDRMWEFVMRHEAKECLDIVSEQIGEKLTEEQKEQVLKEYVYDTTACTVYNYPIMKRTIKQIKSGKHWA